MSQSHAPTVSVLAMPGQGCWTVYLPELGLGGVVESRQEIETLVSDLVGRSSKGDPDTGWVDFEIDIRPPLTTYPIPARWLSPAADDKINTSLGQAYCWPDYPGQRAGRGRWVDLYWDEDRECPVGRLWTDDNNGCGLLLVNGMDDVEYTVAALLIRHLHRAGVLASLAFEVLRSRYTTGPLQAEPLDGIADLDIEQNQRFLNGAVMPRG